MIFYFAPASIFALKLKYLIFCTHLMYISVIDLTILYQHWTVRPSDTTLCHYNQIGYTHQSINWRLLPDVKHKSPTSLLQIAMPWVFLSSSFQVLFILWMSIFNYWRDGYLGLPPLLMSSGLHVIACLVTEIDDSLKSCTHTCLLFNPAYDDYLHFTVHYILIMLMMMIMTVLVVTIMLLMMLLLMLLLLIMMITLSHIKTLLK